MADASRCVRAASVSIPRDSWVKIDGYPYGNGHAKINAAFSYGGPKLALQTVEELTDISSTAWRSSTGSASAI